MEKKPPVWKREIDAGAGLVFFALVSAGIGAVYYWSSAGAAGGARQQLELLREATAGRGTLRVASGKAPLLPPTSGSWEPS